MSCCFPQKDHEELASSDEVPDMTLYDIRSVGAKCRSLQSTFLRCRLLHAIATFRENYRHRPVKTRPRKTAAKRARMRRECAALQQLRARAARPGTPLPPG